MESSRHAAVATLTALYLLAFISSSVHAQNLTAVKCEALLPTGRSDFALLYDNNDIVYLFGGTMGNRDYADVVKYSISQDTAEIVAQLPHTTRGGDGVMNKFRNIFYLSGVGGDGIYQYFPDLRSFERVSSFAEHNSYFAKVIPDADTALLFGGRNTNIMKVNLNTLESEEIGHLPEDASYSSAIWAEEKNAAYIFQFNGKTIQKYDRATNSAQKLAVEIPTETFGAVSDGKFGYLIPRPKAENPGQSLLQFDPETESFAVIPVEGYPAVEWSRAVYIQGLNRIYMFGGYTRDGPSLYHDGIYYIDLDPLTQPPTPPPTTTEETPNPSTMDPDVFDCLGRPDSNYPYPGDCTKFVICLRGHGYPFNCVEPLHFDPVNRHCTFPEKARCEVNE